eukprot:867381_1
MALQYSTIVAIIYFVVTIVFLFGLSFYVYKSGKHKFKSKSYIKDVWSQKSIFFPLIVQFYDTATDIGVLCNWYILMKQEEDPNTDYESVNMKSFFWCGVASLILYRVMVALWMIVNLLSGDPRFKWHHVLLALFDLYTFVVVYKSFNAAHGIITQNAEIRQKNAERKNEVAVETGKSTDKDQEIEIALEDEVEIEPIQDQMVLQFLESITESMPQIVLQSVFIIKSANGANIAGSNTGLLLLSVLASLFSISNKFVWGDKDRVFDIAKSLKPRQSFPDCIHYWYIIRALWRLCHTLSKFAAFTLIWAVMGGAWLPIWVGTIYIVWSLRDMRQSRTAALRDEYEFYDVYRGFGTGIFYIIAIFDTAKQYASDFVLKWIETTIAFIVITVFATLQFECGICASSGSRMLFENVHENDRIFIYWIIGIVAHMMDVVLYVLLYDANIFLGESHIIYHNRWMHLFESMGDPETKSVQFKNFIADYETERITGIRLVDSRAGRHYDESILKSIELQVNGVWKGRMKRPGGEHRPIGPNTRILLLDDDEYVNEVRLMGVFGVQFCTNKSNSIEAGKMSGNAADVTTLKGSGDFKLVDCRA